MRHLAKTINKEISGVEDLVVDDPTTNKGRIGGFLRYLAAPPDPDKIDPWYASKEDPKRCISQLLKQELAKSEVYPDGTIGEAMLTKSLSVCGDLSQVAIPPTVEMLKVNLYSRPFELSSDW